MFARRFYDRYKRFLKTNSTTLAWLISARARSDGIADRVPAKNISFLIEV